MKSTLSERGQVTIPKRLRQRLGLRPGQVLEFFEERGRMVATKAVEVDPLDSVYGILSLAVGVDNLLSELRGPAVVPKPAPKQRCKRR